MVDQGRASTRSHAKALIMAGKVLAGGIPVTKAGALLAPDVTLTLKESSDFASRGGIKLAGALDDLGLDVRGWKCLDIGASTGGFTDCLLQRGAAGVTAVDVGYGLIDWKLRNDPRVTVLERTNARYLEPGRVDGPFDFAVDRCVVYFPGPGAAPGDPGDPAPGPDSVPGQAAVRSRPRKSGAGRGRPGPGTSGRSRGPGCRTGPRSLGSGSCPLHTGPHQGTQGKPGALPADESPGDGRSRR